MTADVLDREDALVGVHHGHLGVAAEVDRDDGTDRDLVDGGGMPKGHA
jgi:hypothetical protein